jgi:hypothetical protein
VVHHSSRQGGMIEHTELIVAAALILYNISRESRIQLGLLVAAGMAAGRARMVIAKWVLARPLGVLGRTAGDVRHLDPDVFGNILNMMLTHAWPPVT